jgi:hypothetical protein
MMRLPWFNPVLPVFSNPEMSLKGGFEAGSFRRLLPGDFLTSFSS